MKKLEMVPTFAEQEALELQQERAGLAEGGDMVKACEGHVCSVNSNHCLGCSDCKYERGHHERLSWLSAERFQQRGHGQNEAATGTCCTSRYLLSGGAGQHEQEDESCEQFRGNSSAVAQSGSLPYKVRGKSRDMGYVMWQLAMLMDYLQAENWQGARDSAAL